jgi:hypothetical protein
MGTFQHHVIIVTGFDLPEFKFEVIHNKAKEIFNKEIPYYSDINLVTEIMESNVNEWKTFFIAPDGSKEFWEHSITYDQRRSEFINYMKSTDGICECILVSYGEYGANICDYKNTL